MKALNNNRKWMLVLGLVLVFTSCGTSHSKRLNKGYGGGWSTANQGVTPGELPGPGDSMRNPEFQVSAVRSNLNHIKSDIKNMTSREKVPFLRSDLPSIVRGNTEENSKSGQTDNKHNSANGNIYTGVGLGLAGLLAIAVYPILGFAILITGILIGVVGIYKISEPGI